MCQHLMVCSGACRQQEASLPCTHRIGFMSKLATYCMPGIVLDKHCCRVSCYCSCTSCW
jgi:hypothetical protein